MQLEWVDAHTQEPSEAEKTANGSRFEIYDFRDSLDPLKDLAEVTTKAETVVWREGSSNGEPKGLQRAHLVPAETLVIWNPPQGDQNCCWRWSKFNLLPWLCSQSRPAAMSRRSS